MVQFMQLDRHFRAAHTVADGIIFIEDMIVAGEQILATHPDVLVADIGSNDIARYCNVEPQKMLHLAHVLHETLHSFAVPLIVVNAVLPRTGRLAGTPETFLKNADLFNLYLAEMNSLTPAVVYNKMRGFQYTHTQGQDLPRPVKQWSDDGIHCTSQSMLSYQQRIRHAILDNCFRMRSYQHRR
jgi:hypothetical protein